MNHAKVVLDEDDVRRTLVRIAHEIVEKNAGQPVALVGVHRRGAHLATRLHRLVCDLLDEEVPLGDLDISFYRDDVATRPVDPAVHDSHLPFRLDDYTVVLVDDVLYTGRTARAGIEALFDYGRPARVQLAVLADRGHRELPIRPDYVGKNLPTARDDRADPGSRQVLHRGVRARDQEGPRAARPPCAQPLLGGLDAHALELRAGRQGAERRRRQPLVERQRDREGRVAQGHRADTV